MIAKRSTRKDKKSSFDGLASYLLDSHKTEERLLYSIFTNCLSDDPELALREIRATQGMNTRAKDNKTYHLIVSFRQGDKPTPEQLKAIEQGMADALGLGSHQRLSVLHGDTDHLHLHLAINKIHPETYQMVTPYRDFFHLSAACRRFEQEYGLGVDNGIPDAERISAKARDSEAFQGLPSFQRWAQGEPRQRLAAALERPDANWQSVHAALGEYNLAIQPRGAGLVIVDRDDSRLHIRASQMDRGFSKQALEGRLGAYEPPAGRRTRAGERFEARPGGDGKDARAKLWAIYQREREARAKARKAAWTDYRRQREQAFGNVAMVYQQEKQAIRQDSSQRAAQRRAQLSVLRMRRAQEEKALLAGFAEQRQAMQQAHRNETFQAFLERRAAEGDVLALAALRASGRSDVPGQAASIGGSPREGLPMFLGFDFRVHRNGDVTYQLGKGHQRLTDTRDSLLVGQRDEAVGDPTLEIALRVAQMKFGNTLRLNGSEDFQQRAAELAGRLQMRVHFSDEALEAIRKAARPAVSHVKKDALSAYAKAIGATVVRLGEAVDAQFRGLRQLHDGQKVGVFVAGERTLLVPLTHEQADALSGRPFRAKASGPADAGRR